MFLEFAKEIFDRSLIAEIKIGHLRQEHLLEHDHDAGNRRCVPVQPDRRLTDAAQPVRGFKHEQQNVDTGFQMTGPSDRSMDTGRAKRENDAVASFRAMLDALAGS